MASLNTEVLDLVRRCERVGWTVVTGSRGVKVTNPEGHTIPIHKTPGSRASLDLTVAQLEKAGLKQAEKMMAAAKITRGRQRTEAGRTAAAKKTATLAAKNGGTALTKAAGPYLTEPEDVGVLWFAEKHPAPWMRWVNITAEIADYLLTNHNTLNRPLSMRQVEHYTRIIQSGQWHLTHQGVAMDTDAVLQDGQHRLAAVIAAAEDLDDLKVPFAFFVGMPTQNFKAIDEGLLRTATQLFSRGAEKNGSALQGGIRLVISYADANGDYGYHIKLPNEKVIDTFAEDPEEFRLAAGHGLSHYRKYYSTPGAITAARYLIRRANGPDNTYVAAFFEGLMTGRKAGTRWALDDADPRNVFREAMKNAKLGKKRISSRDQLAMIITSWNNLVNNYTPRYLKLSKDSTMPRVLVCRDIGPGACPALLAGEIREKDDAE